MKTIYLEVEKRQVKTSKAMVKSLLWFDVKTGEMHKFIGSELKFEYDIHERRMKPYVEKEKVEEPSNPIPVKLKYDFAEKKLAVQGEDQKPKLLKSVGYDTVSNKQQIIKWILANQVSLDFELNPEECRGNLIAINVQDDNEEEVKSAIETAGFRYN
jgi:hypothetical protein